MIALHLAPVVLAFAVLAAHFHRAEWLPLAAASLLMPALLFVRRPWAARALQLALAAGALEWLRTLAGLVATRLALAQPYARLALILGVVAVATALVALVFERPAVRTHFGLRGANTRNRGAP